MVFGCLSRARPPVLAVHWQVNAANAKGATALHDAAERGDAGIVQIILDGGGDTEVRGTKGNMKGKRPGDVVAHRDRDTRNVIRKMLGVEPEPEPQYVWVDFWSLADVASVVDVADGSIAMP